MKIPSILTVFAKAAAATVLVSGLSACATNQEVLQRQDPNAQCFAQGGGGTSRVQEDLERILHYSTLGDDMLKEIKDKKFEICFTDLPGDQLYDYRTWENYLAIDYQMRDAAEKNPDSHDYYGYIAVTEMAKVATNTIENAMLRREFERSADLAPREWMMWMRAVDAHVRTAFMGHIYDVYFNARSGKAWNVLVADPVYSADTKIFMDQINQGGSIEDAQAAVFTARYKDGFNTGIDRDQEYLRWYDQEIDTKWEWESYVCGEDEDGNYEYCSELVAYPPPDSFGDTLIQPGHFTHLSLSYNDDRAYLPEAKAAELVKFGHTYPYEPAREDYLKRLEEELRDCCAGFADDPTPRPKPKNLIEMIFGVPKQGLVAQHEGTANKPSLSPGIP